MACGRVAYHVLDNADLVRGNGIPPRPVVLGVGVSLAVLLVRRDGGGCRAPLVWGLLNDLGSVHNHRRVDGIGRVLEAATTAVWPDGNVPVDVRAEAYRPQGALAGEDANDASGHWGDL